MIAPLMRVIAYVSNLISRSSSKRSIALMRPTSPYEIRSDSSTWAGSPDAIRPDTYFTSGEYATTRRSRAAGSPEVLYRLHRSLSSMALTFVSREIPPPRRTVSGAGMRSGVGGLQARRLYPSVDLRRAHGAVAQELLDRPQVGAPVQEVRREGVTQRVRRDPALDRSLPRP